VKNDGTICSEGGSHMGGTGEPADERWADGSNGGAARVVLVGAVGAGLLLAGAAGTRAVLAEAALPPWAGMGLYVVSGIVAVAGMVLAARAGRRHAAPRAPLPAEPPPATAAAARSGGLDRFQVDTRSGRKVVAAAQVEWIQARGNYARLHLGAEDYLYRMPLAQIEAELDTALFLRVHRSVIVNLDAVRRVAPLPSGDAELELASGARVRLSRRYADAFHARTGRGR
jgi:hypothetical protein